MCYTVDILWYLLIHVYHFPQTYKSLQRYCNCKRRTLSGTVTTSVGLSYLLQQV